MTLTTILAYAFAIYLAVGLAYCIWFTFAGCGVLSVIKDVCLFIGWILLALLGWPYFVWADSKTRRFLGDEGGPR